MREISADEAESSLNSLLDRIEQGDEIVITRGGMPVAKLVRADSGADDACRRARAAAAGIREMRKGVTLGGLDLKALIDEGRH